MASHLDIVVVGGSLSGLISGIVLKHAGHNVTIIEREPDERYSHMAGIALGPDFQQFALLHDRLDSKYTVECRGMQIVKGATGALSFIQSSRAMTTWDALYFRLRAHFDGLASAHCPQAPPQLLSDGTGEYRSNHKALRICPGPSKDKLIVKAMNCNTREIVDMKADFVIGADGTNSWVRQQYLPMCRRRYSGYVGWRGTVLRRELKSETQSFFQRNVTLLAMENHHCLVSVIPGRNGSLAPEDQMLNFLWYTNATADKLAELMKDNKTGLQHHYTVPSGHVCDHIWKEQLSYAESSGFTLPFLEVMKKIRQPFIQAITDFCSPQAAFEDGKILLIGDALSTFRPHIAFSTNQAAFHALRTEEYLAGKSSRATWEERMVRFSLVHWAQSVWWGEFYQNGIYSAGTALLQYWRHCAVDRFKAWWYGEAPLLRVYGQIRKDECIDGNRSNGTTNP